jgi:hypothetical protein
LRKLWWDRINRSSTQASSPFSRVSSTAARLTESLQKLKYSVSSLASEAVPSSQLDKLLISLALGRLKLKSRELRSTKESSINVSMLTS